MRKKPSKLEWLNIGITCSEAEESAHCVFFLCLKSGTTLDISSTKQKLGLDDLEGSPPT